ncbi:type II toxin-antitoxin system HicA family toxin [Sphingomonas bacterium]|uniref:type II toxin-antitoxin system HicA family toxin n=1 Tax=Sphingomonas bacterium TaxID=1895847 RepID=UPI001575CFA7|nr:type II toxin-antitoxin system HicA family toxin [Sphingomonas bacterium]
MTRVAKLHASILANPRSPIPFREFERLLVAFGFALDRISGSHRIYGHPRVDRMLNIQPRGKEAKPYQLVQFLDIVEEFGLEIE